MKYKVFVSTAEVSGDEQAANLVRALIAKYPDTFTFTALGGEALRSLGVTILEDISTESAVGFSESIPYIKSSLKLLKSLELYFQKEKFDLFLAMDGQGRNIPLSRIAKKAGMKTVWYFPPILFVWGKNDITKLDATDLFLCAFEPNADHYIQNGKNALYVGHPFSLIPKSKKDEPKPIQLSVFPGSRKQELLETAPIILQAAARLSERYKNNIEISVPVSHPAFKNEIETLCATYLPQAKITLGDSDSILSKSHFAIMASGTATLKAAFYDTPCTICYKVSPITYFIAKFILKLKYIGMLNILGNQEICTEFINKKLNVGELYDYSVRMIDSIGNKTGPYETTILNIQKVVLKMKNIMPYELATTAIMALLKK